MRLLGAVGEKRWKNGRERAASEKLALGLNSLLGADYECFPGEDPPDTVLRSAAGGFSDLRVEITSLPAQEWWNREDNGNVTRFRDKVTEWIGQQYPRGYLFNLQLAEELKQKGISPEDLHSLLESLEKLSHGLAVGGAVGHAEEQIAPQLSKKFTLILIVNYGTDARSELRAWVGHDQPTSSAWICDAIGAKAKRYGQRSYCDILLLDAATPLIDEQLRDFQEKIGRQKLPFDQIWLVGRWNATQRLK